MLSRGSRLLTYILALLYALIGAALFVLPAQLAPAFAWQGTPFMTITIGGWCLGNAWLAWLTARRWQWGLVYASLIYLWIFGVMQAGVVFAFQSKLRLVHPIAWLYLATLAINVVAALVGLADWFRLRPRLDDFGPVRGRGILIATIAFVIAVAGLGIYGLLARNGAAGTNRGIFPELMSDFTLRSFGAFYLSLALGAIPLIPDRNLAASLHHGFASFGLIVAITLAAFIYIGLFNFVERPGGLAYFGAYILVGIPLLLVLLRKGTGAPAAAH